jgi:hypothetical protein
MKKKNKQEMQYALSRFQPKAKDHLNGIKD